MAFGKSKNRMPMPEVEVPQTSSSAGVPSTFEDVQHQVEKEVEIQKTEEDFDRRLAVFQKACESIDKSVSSLNHAIETLNSFMEALKEAQKKFGGDTLSILEKLVSVETLVNKLIAEAPAKFEVTVTLSEKSKKEFMAICNDQVQKMNETHQKNLEELRQENAKSENRLYAQTNERRSDIHKMLSESDGFYVSGFMYWLHIIFFWIGIIVTVGFISAKIISF